MPPRQQSSSEPAAAKTIRGVDVSSFQGPPGAWRAAAGNAKWVAVKLTELQPRNVPYVNPDAAEDWSYVGSQRLGRKGDTFAQPAVGPPETVAPFPKEPHLLRLRNTHRLMLAFEVTTRRSATRGRALAR